MFLPHLRYSVTLLVIEHLIRKIRISQDDEFQDMPRPRTYRIFRCDISQLFLTYFSVDQGKESK